MRNLNISTLENDGAAGQRLDNDFFLYQGDSSDVVPDTEMLRLDVLGLCYVQRGEYAITVNGRRWNLYPGDLLVCHPNDFFEDVTFSRDFYGMIVFGSVDLIADTVDAMRLHRRLEAIKNNPVMTLSQNHQRLLDSYGNIFKTQKEMTATETSALIGKCMLVDIFNYIIPDVVNDNNEGTLTRSKVIYQRFINLLVSTIQKPHDTESYANKLNISAKYLSKICTRESGTTAKEWIHKYIMNDARRYLVSSDLSIKEIANRLGFNNFSFFCRSVRKHFGKTPLEIRNSR